MSIMIIQKMLMMRRVKIASSQEESVMFARARDSGDD